MMKQMIIEIDASASFSEMSEDIQKAVNRANIQWPQDKMVGTQEIDGKKLILILCSISGSELEEWMNGTYIEDDQEQTEHQFDLGWKVLAEEDKKIVQKPIKAYMSPIPVYEENDEGEMVQTGEKAIISLKGILQTWSGRKWQF